MAPSYPRAPWSPLFSDSRLFLCLIPARHRTRYRNAKVFVKKRVLACMRASGVQGSAAESAGANFRRQPGWGRNHANLEPVRVAANHGTDPRRGPRRTPRRQPSARVDFPSHQLISLKRNGPSDGNREIVRLVTLGPTGTRHERAANEYMASRFENSGIELGRSYGTPQAFPGRADRDPLANAVPGGGGPEWLAATPPAANTAARPAGSSGWPPG
jgi:hypothetical protein